MEMDRYQYGVPPISSHSSGHGRPGTSQGGSLPSPASQACRNAHGTLPGRDVAPVGPAPLVPFDRPHPGSPFGVRGIGPEDSPDVPISIEHVVIVLGPVAGWSRDAGAA